MNNWLRTLLIQQPADASIRTADESSSSSSATSGQPEPSNEISTREEVRKNLPSSGFVASSANESSGTPAVKDEFLGIQ